MIKNKGIGGYATVDVKRAERMLKEAGRHFSKANRRTVARGAAKILQDDMRSGSGGIVPKYTKARYHIFSRKGYHVKVRAGNLRKSMKMFTFRRSGLMWVGPQYRGSLNGQTIGETYRTADGFYDKMYIAKTGNNFHTKSLARKESEIKSRLTRDSDAYIKKVINKAHATP